MNVLHAAMSAVIMAGGEGSRLYQLTSMARRPKPAVSFGGKYRIIDFVLNSVINSGVAHTHVLTQYAGNVIVKYLRQFGFNSPIYDRTVETYAPAKHGGHGWYTGTANAVYQTWDDIAADNAEVVAILAADHIYKINLVEMYDFHVARGADFTVCGITCPVEDAHRFGVLGVEKNGMVIDFEEKPKHPSTLPDDKGRSMVSMGIYLVNKRYLEEILREDHYDETSSHDFGKDIIPKLVKNNERVYCWMFDSSRVPGEDFDGPVYWEDVGEPGAYMRAQMDLVSAKPRFNIHNTEWPIRTVPDWLPPAKDVFPDKDRWLHDFSQECPYHPNRIASGGCIFDSPRQMEQVVCGRNVYTGYGADIVQSVLFDGAHIGEGAQLRNTIVEESVVIPSGTRVGYDLEEDLAHGIILGVTREEYATKMYFDMDPARIVRIVRKGHTL